MNLQGLPADQAARWQWLADYFYHFDDCMDELKKEVENFAVWKKSLEKAGLGQAATIALVKLEVRAAVAGVGLTLTILGILRALGVV